MPAPTASLTVRKLIPCSPDIAFRAWTEPAQFEAWFVPPPTKKVKAQYDLRVGGKYQLIFILPDGKPEVKVVGEFLVVDRPHRLEYTWMWQNNPDWKDRTVVKIDFKAAGKDQTEVVLSHENFSDPEDRDEHTKGWTGILDRMAVALKQK